MVGLKYYYKTYQSIVSMISSGYVQEADICTMKSIFITRMQPKNRIEGNKMNELVIDTSHAAIPQP